MEMEVKRELNDNNYPESVNIYLQYETFIGILTLLMGSVLSDRFALF